MTPKQVLSEAAFAGRTNQFYLTRHVLQERMPERGASRLDIAQALQSSTSARQEDGSKWKLEGGVHSH